mmetsp:Transcript_16077/g.47179  ORF Transcript_16077/g.47179 Transcript_16077/m.47179 type:complete len:211 (+) Transcript_16077:216-848(+)
MVTSVSWLTCPASQETHPQTCPRRLCASNGAPAILHPRPEMLSPRTTRRSPCRALWPLQRPSPVAAEASSWKTRRRAEVACGARLRPSFSLAKAPSSLGSPKAGNWTTWAQSRKRSFSPFAGAQPCSGTRSPRRGKMPSREGAHLVGRRTKMRHRRKTHPSPPGPWRKTSTSGGRGSCATCGSTAVHMFPLKHTAATQHQKSSYTRMGPR